MDMKQLSDDINQINETKSSLVITLIGWVALAVVGLVGFKIGKRSGIRSMK